VQAPDGVEETDELLLWDEEMADVDPECLPKRLITDFSISNVSGMLLHLMVMIVDVGIYNGKVRDADCNIYSVTGRWLHLMTNSIPRALSALSACKAPHH
jgi:hypothetical protein